MEKSYPELLSKLQVWQLKRTQVLLVLRTLTLRSTKRSFQKRTQWSISGESHESFKYDQKSVIWSVQFWHFIKFNSTNARQRSLQLMQSKFSKNNQPCLVFRRYGYCPKQDRGTCFKVHDKKRVALCQKYISDTFLVYSFISKQKESDSFFFLDRRQIVKQ